MSKIEENYLEVITIIQNNNNTAEDYSEIIEYEPDNEESEVIYEYVEVEDQIVDENDIQFIHKPDLELTASNFHNIRREDKFRCQNRGCKRNNVAFESKLELDVHNEIHTEQFHNSICPICNKILANQTKLLNHMELRHTPKSYTCDHCGKIFRSKDNLRLHMTHHRKYFYVECRACNRGYKSMQSLRYHLRQHFEHHQCDECGRVFEHKKLLLGHIAAMHNTQLQVQCKFCTRMFARSDVRDAHEREIHKNGMVGSHFRCDQCNAAFDLRDELMSHKILSHFNGVIHTCKECGKNFKKKSLLDLHMNVHRKKQIQCDICKQMFTFITGLNKHKKMGRCKGPPSEALVDNMTKEEIAKIAKQQLIEITVNPKKFHDEQQIDLIYQNDAILAVNKNVQVDRKKVGRKPKLVMSASNHLNNINPHGMFNVLKNKKDNKKQTVVVRNLTQEEIQQQQKEQQSDHEEVLKSSKGRIIKRKFPPVIASAFYQRPFIPKRSVYLTCDLCGDNFDSKLSLISHLKNHMLSKRSISSHHHSFDELENKSSTAKQQNVKTHELQSMSISKEKKFACDICDKRYFTKHLLGLHKKSHENLREFKCQNENCSFETNSPYDLNNHIKRIHTATRPYKCPECNKKFKRRCDMINHKKSVHTDVKTYVKCPVCETIVLEKGLQSHMINRHSEKAQQKPYECTICGKRERYEKVLQRHYYAVHEPKDRGVVYQCPDCPKHFYRRRDVTAHSFEHYDGEIFECQTCSNRYKTKKELSNHEYTHYAAEYPCPYCEQVFQTKSGRGKHLKKHYNPDPNVPICNPKKEHDDDDDDDYGGASDGNDENILYEEYEILEDEQDVNII